MEIYIAPNLRVLATFDETDKHLKNDPTSLGFDRSRGVISDLLPLNRCLVVAEPGMGKSVLLARLAQAFTEGGRNPRLRCLREPKTLSFLQELLKGEPGTEPLLLDALDETSAVTRATTLALIEDLSARDPNLPIFVSSRWASVRAHRHSFDNYRYAALTPLSWKQVREYLRLHGRTDAQFDHAWKAFQRGWSTSVLQTPRYLKLLNESFDSDRSAAPKSRRELFAHFVRNKLRLEDTNRGRDLAAINARVLAKVALVMEIFQASSITKDDLLTVLDQIRSDLKVIALSEVPFDALSGNSLLRIGHGDEDTVEFENVEFQEFLAAEELARMPDPARAAFAFAVELGTHDVLPSWHNTLTFLGEADPQLLARLVEFANFSGSVERLVDDEFVVFLSRFDPSVLSGSSRRKLFIDILNHFQSQRRFLPYQIGSFLRALFDPSHEGALRSWMAQVNTTKEGFVLEANIVSVVGDILETPSGLDTSYWRSELVRIAKVRGEHSEPQRNAIYALAQMADASIVTEFSEFNSRDEGVRKALFSMLAKLAPDDPITVDQLVAGVHEGILEARSGLRRIQSAQSFRRLLDELSGSEEFATNFLKHGDLRVDDDTTLIQRLTDVLSPELLTCVRRAVVATLRHQVVAEAEDSRFIKGMWRLLYDQDKTSLQQIVRDAVNFPQQQLAIHRLPRLIAPLLREEDVAGFVGDLLDLGQEMLAFRILLACQGNDEATGTAIFERGRSLMPRVYADFDAANPRTRRKDPPKAASLVTEFLLRLEPEPGLYLFSVFEFLNEHHQELQGALTPARKARLQKLSTDILSSWKPKAFQLGVDGASGAHTFTLSGGVSIFGDALRSASLLGVDLSAVRGNLIDFIPFASGDERKEILRRVSPIRPDEAKRIVDSYRSPASPFRKYQPETFIETAEQLAHGGAMEVLKSFVEDASAAFYLRRRALEVLDSANPDENYLRTIFSLRRPGNRNETLLAECANALLITNHGDETAFRWRLAEVVARAAPFQHPKGAHSVGDLEAELRDGSRFAFPLTSLAHRDREDAYLGFIDESLAVWRRGQPFHAYADYMQRIVYAYFNNLRRFGSYSPLLRLERKLAEIRQEEGANWLATRMLELRRSYLTALGRPRSMAAAIALYGKELDRQALQIGTADDLAIHLRDCLDGDVRQWVEGEGAYRFLVGRKVFKTKTQQYEALVQRTLGAQIEKFLQRKGFAVEVLREPQTIGDTRVDFLVRYGFAGPVLIELKLASSRDLRARDLTAQASFISLKSYMSDLSASRAIFVVVDNVANAKLEAIRSAYGGLAGVDVVVLRAGGGEEPRGRRSREEALRRRQRSQGGASRSKSSGASVKPLKKKETRRQSRTTATRRKAAQ